MVPNAAESTAVAEVTSIWTTPDALPNFFAKHLLKQLLHLRRTNWEVSQFLQSSAHFGTRTLKALSCILAFLHTTACNFAAL